MVVLRRVALALFGVFLLLGGALAQPATQQNAGPTLAEAPALFETWEQEAERIRAAVSEEVPSDERADRFRETLDRQRNQAATIADLARRDVRALRDQLDALGPAPEEGESEGETVAGNRAELTKRLQVREGIASSAELATARADTLVTTIANRQREAFTEQLLTRGPSPIDPGVWLTATSATLRLLESLIAEGIGSFGSAFGAASAGGGLPLLIGAFIAALVIAVVMRRALLQFLARLLWTGGDGANPSRTRRILTGIGLALVRLVLPMLALGIVWGVLRQLDLLGPRGTLLLDAGAQGIAVIIAAYVLSVSFFSPQNATLRLSRLDDGSAAQAVLLSMLMALSFALDLFVMGPGEAFGLPLEALSVFNLVIISVGAMALWRLAALVRAPEPQTPEPNAEPDEEVSAAEPEPLSSRAVAFFRRLSYFVAAAAPVLAFLGYFALSRFIFHNFLLSVGVVCVCVLLYVLAEEASSALSEAARDKNRKEKDDTPVSQSLLPVFFGAILACGAAVMLALIWGATPSDLEEAYRTVTTGFKIGDASFRPSDILRAALVFTIGIIATRVFQAIMRRSILPRTRLDVGARSSITAGLGYLGFFIAALVAVGAGGIDLSNIAIVAGALSVGIGFGLQNIVNNFVSGVILLIERPIKVGDWIAVGGQQGYVQRVNVRSTEIQTFDKSSFIVPNSELISGSVLNMTHDNLEGRVIVPVGVAYGTDPRKVERILLDIGRAHPMLLRRPAPFVVFQQFGADSLDFELRGYLRDVNWVLSTKSDINYEIERRFREEGIEIPFRQHDVAIRGLEDILERTSGRPRGAPHHPGNTAMPEMPDSDV